MKCKRFFHFKRYATNVYGKIKCNMILSIFAFHLLAGDFLAYFLRLTSPSNSCHPAKNIYLLLVFL